MLIQSFTAQNFWLRFLIGYILKEIVYFRPLENTGKKLSFMGKCAMYGLLMNVIIFIAEDY